MRVLAKRRKPRRVSVARDKRYMSWLRIECRCLACEGPGVKMAGVEWAGVIDPAHTINNGRSSRGPDSSCVPLCRRHHDEMDGRLSIAITTKATFAAKYGLNLAAEAAAHYKRFLEEAA